MDRYYLAFGDDLNLSLMQNRCPNAIPILKTVLRDYQLVYKGFRNGEGHLTLEESKGAYVPIGIYQISFLDSIILNHCDGDTNLYEKKYISVKIDGKVRDVFFYIANPELDYCLPSDDYILTCKQGYSDFRFDQTILDNAFKRTLEKLLYKERREKIKI